MPREPSRASARRDVAPATAGRSLWFAAATTGGGAALAGMVIGVVVVGICWLPVSGRSGGAGSVLRAGVLTFLAALHGGVSVDGLASQFLPLGMTLLAGAITWRAGTRLAAVATDLEVTDARTLVKAAAAQAGVFAVLCGIAARLSVLGTSSVSIVSAVFAGFVVCALFGGVALVRGTALADEWRERAPDWLGPAARAAAAGLLAYLAAGALLVAASLIAHHGRVELISRHVGGGWSGVPVLLLGILAAPNAAIAAVGYLSGPGFAIGASSGVNLGSAAHGTLPAFPILGAVPSGPASAAVWLLAVAAPVVAAVCVVRTVRVAGTWRLRMRDAAAGAGVAGVLAALLGWQAGGAIGSGGLSAIGPSPWQLGFAVTGALLVVAEGSLAALAGLEWWRGRDVPAQRVAAPLAAVAPKPARDEVEAEPEAADEPAEVEPPDVAEEPAEEATEGGQLAG